MSVRGCSLRSVVTEQRHLICKNRPYCLEIGLPMSSSIGKRAVVTSTMIASLVGSGLALAPDASAAVSLSMSTKAYNFAYTQAKQHDRYAKPGQSTTGFSTYDCSGLVWRSYQQSGKKWSRESANSMRKNETVDITIHQRRVGDLIFFRKFGSSTYSHVGIYAGHGYMIDAQTSTYYGSGVIKEKVDNSWWTKHYVLDYRRVK